MRLVIFSSGFSSARLRLQPWLTLLEVGLQMKSSGHDVWVATDGADDGKLPLPVRRFKSLRGTQSEEISGWLKKIAPDRVVTSVSPFSLATAGWHASLNPRSAWAFLPYALYSGGEMARAWRHLIPADRWGYGRNLVIPRGVWQRRLARRFRGVICQSRRTIDRLGVGIRGEAISPGIDLDQWRPAENADRSDAGQQPFLYVGSPKSIRGFNVLLDAMKRLPPAIRLRVLARGLDADGETALRQRLSGIGIADRVDVRGGWLSRDDLVSEIRQAAAVVLPFVLVPSEIPVSVMEVIACGTPVIVTDIDGLPEAVGPAGLVVPPGDSIALGGAMKNLSQNHGHLQSLRDACLVQRRRYTGWSEVAQQWAARLEEN